MELISVIIPVYNSEQYLHRCLDSVLAQSYDNLEIILVDDGSTDKSPLICEEFAAKDMRARVIHQYNQGLWAARNSGRDAAHGDYLFFPDSDDYFHRETLKILYDAINSGPGYELAIAGRKRTDSLDEDVSSAVTPSLEEWPQQRLLKTLTSEKSDSYCVYVWNKLYRASLLEEISSRKYFRSEDLDLNMRVFFRLDKAIVVKNVLYYWYQHEGSLTHMQDAWDIYFECRTDIYYRNAMDMPQNLRRFKHLLLRRLYRKIVIWRQRMWRTARREEVVKTCRHYFNDTRMAYLFNLRIPLYERIGVSTLVAFPRLAFRVLKALGN